MRAQTVVTHAALVLLFGLPVSVNGQAQAPEGREVPDTNNAVIEGRVRLPSGFSAERNVKITLKNSQSTLSTLFSNKHGEFRFDNLSQGIYYVQAEIVGASFEPVVERVMLGRGITYELTIQFGEDQAAEAPELTSRVVSAAELRQKVPAAAKKEYVQGMKFVRVGDILQAASHFAAAIAIYPQYLAARNDLGAQFLKQKKLDEAEKNFQMVLADDPKNFNAKFNMGLVRMERKNYSDAIAQLNEAIVIDSSRPVARLWLGFALLESGDVAGAERELTKALVMGGAECVAAHYHLARIYLSRGDLAEAARSVRAYLEEAPKGEYVKEAKALELELAKRKN
jgi:Tfp pilus assembly protein PilF